jgi:hypothetical protein
VTSVWVLHEIGEAVPQTLFGHPKQAASVHAVSVVTAHTAEQIISVVTVETPDSLAAVAVVLAVVSEALGRPAASPSL